MDSNLIENPKKIGNSSPNSRIRKLKRKIRRRGHDNVEVGRICREILAERPALSIRGLARELGVHDRTVAFKLTAARHADETGNDAQGSGLTFRQAQKYRGFPVKHHAGESRRVDGKESLHAEKESERIFDIWNECGQSARDLFVAYLTTVEVYREFEHITRAWNQSSPGAQVKFLEYAGEFREELERLRQQEKWKKRAIRKAEMRRLLQKSRKKNKLPDMAPAQPELPPGDPVLADAFDLILKTNLDRPDYRKMLRKLPRDEVMAKVKQDLNPRPGFRAKRHRSG